MPPQPRISLPGTSLLLLVIFPLTTAIAVASTKSAAGDLAASVGTSGANSGCGFVGNSDVYGLGIRIGLYSQWLSTLISNWFHHYNLTRMRDVNTCFQMAMMISLLAVTSRSQVVRPHAVEVYIIMMQIIGSVCLRPTPFVCFALTLIVVKSCTVSNHATSESKWGETTWGGVIRFFVYFIVAGYSTFFWFTDLDRLGELEPGCSAYGFFFAKVGLASPWFRWIHKIGSISALAIFTILLSYTVYRHGRLFVDNSFIGDLRRKRQEKRNRGTINRDPYGIQKLLDDVVNPNADMPIVHRFTPAVCFAVFVIAIAAIECLVVWNGITGVDEAFGTGQLIPLVTGVGGLLRVLYLMWSEPGLRLHLVHLEKNLPTIPRSAGQMQSYVMESYKGAEQAVLSRTRQVPRE